MGLVLVIVLLALLFTGLGIVFVYAAQLARARKSFPFRVIAAGGLSTLIAVSLMSVTPHVAAASGAVAHGNRAVPSHTETQSASQSGLLSAYGTTSGTSLGEGERETAISLVPSNYQTTSGAWMPAANTLSAATGGGWTNGGNTWQAGLPQDLSSPVVISDTSGSTSFELTGASGSGSLSGSIVTYDDVLSDVSASYTLLGNGLSESLELSGPQAQSSFSWTVTLPTGASLVSSGGGLDVDLGNNVIATMAAPVMFDAAGVSGPVTLSASGSGDSETVTVNADSSWLSSEEREWPVTIDPTSYVSTPLGCTLNQGAPTTSSCETADLGVGVSSGEQQRAVISLAGLNSTLPIGAQIDSAALQMDVDTVTGSAGTITAYPLTRSFTDAASWDDASSGTPWTTPGGDYSTSALGSEAAPTSGGGEFDMDLAPQAIQALVAGQTTNDGLELISSATSGTNLVDFDPAGDSGAVQIVVYWHYNTQAGGAFPTYSYRVDDELNLDVSLANGQLGLTANDLETYGTGLNADIERQYNSSDLGYGTSVAYDWGLNVGPDVAIVEWPDDLEVYLPGTTGETFYDNGTGSWITPPGVDATMSEPTSGVYKLTFNSSQTVMTFETVSDCDGAIDPLISITDRNGDTITYNYSTTSCGEWDFGELDSLTDTRGRTMTFDNTGAWTTGVSDSSGRSVSYTLGGYEDMYLDSSTDANDNTTDYQYNASDLLDQITDPDGHIITIGYNDDGEVDSITQVTDDLTMAGIATTFSYTPGTVSSPDSGSSTVANDLSATTTYYYDHNGRTTKVVDANGNSTQATYNADNQPLTQTNGLT
jgi:YD repeat-containing protein